MIPVRLLNSTCSILTKTTVSSSKSGQINETWTVAYTAIRCKLDINKQERYISNTTEYEKGTHILMVNKFPVSLNTKDHRIQVEGNEYKIITVNPVNLLSSTPDHFEVELLRVS